MSVSKRGLFKSLAVVPLVALIAACGSSGSGSDSGGTSAPATTASGSGGGAATTAAPANEKADWPEKLVLAAVPAEQDAQLQESYEVTVQILSDELGVDIDFFQAADYAGVIEALIAGRVDLAQFGPFSYVIATANGAKARPVGVMVKDPTEEPGYKSYLVARSDNASINSLNDILGKRVCFVDPGSTSGYLLPLAGLLEEGIDPETDTNPIFAGGHDASVLSVVSGDCDAGFAFDSMVTDLLIDRGEIEEGDVKIVWESPIIAGSPMSMSTTLPQSLQDAIEEIFLTKINVDWAAANGYCATPDPLVCSFSDEAIWGYVARGDDFYNGIRTLCRELGADRAPSCAGI